MRTHRLGVTTSLGCVLFWSTLGWVYRLYSPPTFPFDPIVTPKTHPSIRIWFENLRVTGSQHSVPLGSLTLDQHIHGGLRIEINGRLVPHLGYFGVDDVCFGDWFSELGRIADAFRSGSDARYIYDEGEQGQPAFLFERNGETALFSIIDAEFSGGDSDLDWQRVEFSSEEFLVAYEGCRESFVTLLRNEAPHVADEWLRLHAQSALIESES